MTRARGDSGWSAAGSIGQLLRCCVVVRDAEHHEDGTYTIRCAWCDCALARRDVTIDHLTPRAEGGSNRLGNLVTACVACNCLDGVAARHVPARLWRQAQRPVTREIRELARALALAWYPGLAEKWRKNRAAQHRRDAARRERKHRVAVRKLAAVRERARREDSAYKKARSEGRRAGPMGKSS